MGIFYIHLFLVLFVFTRLLRGRCDRNVLRQFNLSDVINFDIYLREMFLSKNTVQMIGFYMPWVQPP